MKNTGNNKENNISNKDNNNENNNENGYDLYTEHIVKKPWKGMGRKIKKCLLVMLIAAVFGMVAGLVMLVTYKTGIHYLENNGITNAVMNDTESEEETSETETGTGEPITIFPAETETATEVIIEKPEIDDELLETYSEYYKSLKAVTDRIKDSMVTVTVSKENNDWLNTSYHDIFNEFGLVISADDKGYYILTDYSLVGNSLNIEITYPDGVHDNAVFLAGDATTNLAVVKTGTLGVNPVQTAKLGNSNSLSQGDPVIAVGKLYGFAATMGYGMATATDNIVCDTDSSYRLINTDIIGTGSTSGVIANLSGDITGIITTNYASNDSSFVTAYAINDISELLERLGNGITTPYLGIKGQDVNSEITDKYGIPKGVYISAVEANSPAYRSGIQTGDVIFSINENEILTIKDFMNELRKSHAGDNIRLMIKRKGRDEYKEIEFNLMLGVE